MHLLDLGFAEAAMLAQILPLAPPVGGIGSFRQQLEDGKRELQRIRRLLIVHVDRNGCEPV